MVIKFVDYTGKWPVLCHGILTLNIDGKNYTFGYQNSCDYDSFWCSGGAVSFDRNWSGYVEEGPWEVMPDALPKFLKPHAKELAKILNENMEWGCCGGCL